MPQNVRRKRKPETQHGRPPCNAPGKARLPFGLNTPKPGAGNGGRAAGVKHGADAMPPFTSPTDQTETLRLLVIPARDRDATDKLTLTLHGPQTVDRARLVKVLAHLLSTDEEWDGARPNVDLIASVDVGPAIPLATGAHREVSLTVGV